MSTQPPSTASRDGQPLYGQAAAELSVLPASAQSPSVSLRMASGDSRPGDPGLTPIRYLYVQRENLLKSLKSCQAPRSRHRSDGLRLHSSTKQPEPGWVRGSGKDCPFRPGSGVAPQGVHVGKRPLRGMWVARPGLGGIGSVQLVSRSGEPWHDAILARRSRHMGREAETPSHMANPHRTVGTPLSRSDSDADRGHRALRAG
jgi:hypothetical protein